ncbi:MAG: hypothetical protein ACO1RX_22690 [Candidatus Sericytochromatia bacterium]
MSSKLLFTALLATLALSACSTQNAVHLPPSPGVSQNAATQRPVLGSARIKRALQLQRIDGQMVPVAGVHAPASAGFGILQMADIAIGRPAIAPMYYYGGGDFNQYMIQYAEENIYGAPKGDSLLEVYEQTIKPMLAEWDSNARLVESRAAINGTDEEYLYLPGQSGEATKVKPEYVFRFASTPKKETLNVYVMKNEVRGHRMIWGEPNIEISRVKIDSDKALEIAEKAFADKDRRPGYPVYPEQTDANMQVVYDLPDNLKWQLYLNQQSKDELRYYLSFSYEDQVAQPNVNPACGGPNVRCASPYMGTQYLYGSVEIDAISGAIKNLNRPVIYTQLDQGMIEPKPMPIEPGIGDGSTLGGGSDDSSTSSNAGSPASAQ